MAAIGFASIPISVSARDVMSELEKTLGGPMQKAAQKAAEDMEKSLVDGAKRTANEIEKARQAEVRAARDVENAEKKILEAKEKTRQQTVKVETAEKQLEIVRSAQGRKVADMEAAIEKARKDGKTSVEDLTRMEELLREARLKADVAVTSKEEALQKAYRDSEKAARDVEAAEKDRQAAVSKAKDAADNLVAAEARAKDAHTDTAAAVSKAADELDDYGDGAGLFGEKMSKGMDIAAAAVAGAAVAIGAALVGIGSTFDDAYDTIRTGTGASGEDFEALKDSMKAVATESIGVGSDLGAIGSTLADVNTRLGLTGKPLEEMTAQFLQLQGMGVDADINTISAALTQFGVEADAAPGAMDMLFQISQATGRSMTELTANLSKSGPVLQEFGFTLEESAGLLGQLDKAGLDSEKTLQSMTKAMTGFVKDGRDPQTALWETISAIEELTHAGERQEALDLAESVFGPRGRDSFIAAVESGQFAYDDFLDSIGATEDTIGGLAAETADFSEHLDQFKMKALVAVEPLAMALFKELTPAIEMVGEKLTALLGWIEENQTLVATLAVGLSAGAAAFMAWRGAVIAATAVQKALSVATLISTQGFKGLNAAMKANVIGLAVTAVAALVSALVYFFTQTETGQRIWADFTEKLAAGWDWLTGKIGAGIESIKGMWSSFTGWIGAAWDGLKSLFGAGDVTAALSKAFGLDENSPLIVGLLFLRDTAVKVGDAVKTVFDWIVTAGKVAATVLVTAALGPMVVSWTVMSMAVKKLWDGVLKPVIDAIGAAAEWLWEKAVAPALESIQEGFETAAAAVAAVWSWLGEQIGEVWSWISEQVFAALQAGLEVLVTAFTWWAERVRENWQRFQDILSAGWQWVQGNVFSPLSTGLEVLAGWFGTQVDRIAAIWQIFQDVLAAGWRWINDNVFAAIGRGIDTLVGWFDVGVQAMGRLWDGLRRLFAEPVNFVIKTVYTDGIKPVFDGVADKVGLDSRLPEITPIGGFARGGILPGYTPGRDPYTFIDPEAGLSIGLSGGEAILRPEATRALGPEWVERVNAAARTGGVSAVQERLKQSHFADGGVVHLGDFARGGFINLAGALSAIQQSHADFIARFFPDSFALTSASRSEPGSMHDFSRAAATDWQAQDGQFASQMPTPMSKALSRAIYTNFPSTAQLIHHPLDGWENLLHGRAFDYGPGTNAGHRNHVHWGTDSALRFDGDDIVLDDVPGAGVFRFDPAGWFASLWERETGGLPSFDGPGDLGQMPGEALTAMGGWVRDWAMGMLQRWADKIMNFMGGGAGGGAQQWAEQATEALRRMGYGPEHLGAMLRQIEIESSGDPTAINNWDSNAAAGMPSGGLLQVIEPTYRDVRNRYPDAFEGLPDDRFHPLTNLTAGVAAVTRDWGGPAGRWPTTAGYAHGGLAGPGQGMLLKTAIEPEYVLNPEMTKAFIDWMNAGAGLGGQGSVVRIDAPSWDRFTEQVELASEAALDLGRSLEGPFLDSTAEVKKALDELDAAREKAGQGTDKVSDAQKALTDAQKELQEALDGTAETSTSTARKIEDAEAAVTKAREAADEVAKKEYKDAEARAKAEASAAEKVADAQKKLTRAREDEADSAEKSAEKRAAAIEKAEEKVSKAEANLSKARKESASAADDVVKAERRVAQARLEAAGRIVSDVGSAVAGIVSHFARLTATMADLARQTEATEDALAAQRVEAAMAELQRLKALANFTQAEKDLEHARVSGAEMTRLIGDTSVAAMGLALERFRKDGVFSVEMVTNAAEAGAQSVNAVQRDVDAERLAAAHQLQLAALDYAEASLQASHAAEIQKILGYQLLAQQQAIYGVSSMQYDALTQFIMGIVKIIMGVVKIGAGIAAAIAAISAGPAGWIALPGIVAAALSGATDIGQGWTMVQDNNDEAREAWDGMSLEGKANAVMTGLGAAAPAVVGGMGFAMTGDSQILVETAKAMETASKTMVDHTEFLVKRQMDQATVPYEQQIAEATKRHEAELAELRLVREGLITAYESGSDEIAQAVERLLDSVLGESIKPEATDLVVEARSAAEQRDELVQATRQIADRPVEKQPVVVNVTGSGLTVAEVQEVFNYVNSRVDGLQLQVNQIGQQNAVATVAAQR